MNINWSPKDEDLNAFVEAFVDSFASWDLVLFIHFNPSSMDTADGFAARLGRPANETAEALDRFSTLGCVDKSGQGTSCVYSPSLSPEMKETFAKFARAQEDRELRLMLIRSILARNRG